MCTQQCIQSPRPSHARPAQGRPLTIFRLTHIATFFEGAGSFYPANETQPSYVNKCIPGRFLFRMQVLGCVPALLCCTLSEKTIHAVPLCTPSVPLSRQTDSRDPHAQSVSLSHLSTDKPFPAPGRDPLIFVLQFTLQCMEVLVFFDASFLRFCFFTPPLRVSVKTILLLLRYPLSNLGFPYAHCIL